MRFLLLLPFIVSPLLGLSNKVTLRDLSGAPHGTRQFVIPRYFAQDEICSNPKPYIGGVAVTYWQSHVESRWPASAVCAGGAAKFAVIIIETTLGSGENQDVHFRNSADSCHLGLEATCLAAGMSKTDILNFDAGGGLASWGARINASTGGIAQSRSARTMISSDHYQIIRNGPIYAEVLVREGPDAVSAATTRTTNFGWRCTAGCTGPYATSTWTDDATYYSIRPSFWLRFYRRWQKVEMDLVLHSGWMDRFVDQRIDSYDIFTGGGENVAALQQANPIILSPRQTIWEGPFWDGGTPLRSHIDFNLPYLIASRLIPPLNLSNLPTSASTALEVASFNTTDKGATTTVSITPALGWGQLNRTMSTAGANAYVGLFPRWTAKYLATQDADLLDVTLGNARALMHFPFAYLETSGSEWATGTGAAAFGRPVSVEKRPTIMTWYQNASSVTSYTTTVADRVTAPDGTVVTPSCATCYVANSGTTMPWVSSTSATWNPAFVDFAHQVADFFIPYVSTGKPLFREALQHMAAYNAGGSIPATGLYSAGRQYERGLLDSGGNFPRGLFWPLRALGQAAVISPDGSPEKTFFTRILNNNVELTEGKMALTNGSYPPSSATAPYGCPSTVLSDYYSKPSTYASAWCLGRYAWMQGVSNAMGWPGLASNPNSPSISYNVDLRYASEMVSHWMMTYGAMVYGHLRDLGVSRIAPVQTTMSQLFMKLVADSGSGQDWSILGMYYIPLMNAADTATLATPSAVRSGSTRSAKLAKAMTSGASTFYTTKFSNSTYSPGINPGGVSGNGAVRVGSEELVISDQWYLKNYYWRGAITASTDRLAFTIGGCFSGAGCSPLDATGVHFLVDGDLVTIANGGTNVLSGFPIAADTANCHTPAGTDYCTYYVKVIDTRTIELYKDALLTQRVDFTSDVAGTSVYAGLTEWIIMTTNLGRCGGVSCRGIRGTTAAAHSVGEDVVQIPIWPAQSYQTDVDFGYASHYRSALAYAASYGATITDSLTGKVVTGTRAYDLAASLVAYQQRYGDTGTCSGLDVTSCGNPRWGWIPWTQVAPTNIRVTGGTGTATLRWVAPDGGACRYAVAASFDNPDDSADTSDGGGHKSRAATVSGLAAGSYVYRITCGSGRAIGKISVN